MHPELLFHWQRAPFLRAVLPLMAGIAWQWYIQAPIWASLLPGVLGNSESLQEESYINEGYLEYPNFTKPAIWRGIEVPEVLLSGNHAEIAKWRKAASDARN